MHALIYRLIWTDQRYALLHLSHRIKQSIE